MVVLEGLVERQHLPGHLGPDGAGVVALLDVAVALEQVDAPGSRAWPCRRTPRRSPAPASPGCGGMDELIDQARLAHPGLPDQRHHLAVAGPGPLQGLAAGPPAPCCRPTKRVSPRAAAACKRRRSALAPTSSKTSTGSRQPLDRDGPQRVDLHQPLDQPQGRRRSAGYSPAWRAVPCAPPGASSGPRPSSPCADRCQWPAPPPRRS